MNHSAEATQLIVVIAILVVAYFGVMVWTRRIKNRPPAGEGGGGTGVFGGVAGGIAGGIAGSADDRGDIDGLGVPAKKKGPDRHKGRFQLQGKDAETAAKVLKRMLQQDPRNSDQGGKK